MMDFASYLLHNDAEPSDEEVLEQIENDLAAEAPGSYIEEMQGKLAQAYQAGIALAREHGMEALDTAVEKSAMFLADDLVGGAIGHHMGKKQVERGEAYRFGGKQLASALLLPGGAGYQIGRGMAHSGAHADKQEKKAEEQRTDIDRARKWGRTGAAIGLGATALRAPRAIATAGASQAASRLSPKVRALAIGGGLAVGGAQNAAVGYGAGRLVHRMANGPATGKPIEGNHEKKAGLEKVALLPLIEAGAEALGPTVGKAIAGKVAKTGIGSIIGDAAKGVAKNVAINKATSAVQRAAQPSAQMAGGGFKYAEGGGFGKLLGGLGEQAKNFMSSAGAKGPGTLGQKIVGGLVRNPGAALVGAGALGGAVMAPRDPVTGQKEYVRGAMMGGVAGGGAYALGAGNKLRHAVVSPKGPQIFGQEAGAYARDATKATGPSALRAAGAGGGASVHDPVVGWEGAQPIIPHNEPLGGGAGGVQVDPRLQAEASQLSTQHAAMRNAGVGGGGAVAGGGLFGRNRAISSGQMASGGFQTKLANQQTLSYNPATQGFTRTHVTPSLASNSLVSGGGTLASPGLALADIPAGAQAPVGGHMAEPRGPAPAGLGPSGGNSQVFSMHGGDVMSSSPAPGVAARPQVAARPMAAPPPIPASARRPMAGPMTSPITAGAGAALRAAPKAPALPSLSGARSLVSSLK